MTKSMRITTIESFESHDEFDDLLKLKIGNKYLTILVPLDDGSYHSKCLKDKSDTPYGLNLVCQGHYT